MSVKGYYVTEDLYFSSLYGSGIYEWTGQNVQDPIGGDNGNGYMSPLLINKITGETYFMKRLKCSQIAKDYYCSQILIPPNRNNILWPSDLVDLTEEQEKRCNLFVAQEYLANLTPQEKKEGNYAMLFPYGGYPKMISGTRKLAQISEKNWKNPKIRDMAIQILKSIDSINRHGYVYSDIHLSRFFFKEDGSVFLNYSNLIYSFKDFETDARTKICVAVEGEYPIEFAEPAVVRGLYDVMDFNSQNYSLAAMLFYLFFGQYAYDGRLLTGYVDDDLQKHYVKFRDYHKMPVFIFDPQDRKNALGAFDEEQQVIDLWEECPKELKKMFVATLQKENAERSKAVFNPTPKTWLECLGKIGWTSITVAPEKED